MDNTYYLYVAQAYGQSSYSSSNYNGNGQTSTSTGVSSQGSLFNTGTALVGIGTLAVVLIFMALVVRFWRRKSK